MTSEELKEIEDKPKKRQTKPKKQESTNTQAVAETAASVTDTAETNSFFVLPSQDTEDELRPQAASVSMASPAADMGGAQAPVKYKGSFAYNAANGFRGIGERLKTKEGINKLIMTVLAMVLFIVTMSSLSAVLIRNRYFTLRPWQLITATNIESVDFGYAVPLSLIFNIYKYFFIAGAVICTVMFIWMMFLLISRSRKYSTCLNYIMGTWVGYLLLTVLVAYNYINVYSSLFGVQSVTGMLGFLIAGVVIFVLKNILNAILDRGNKSDEIRDSGLSIGKAFMFFTLILGTLITPVYVFPGSPQRLMGINMLLWKKDVLDFLQMSGSMKTIYNMLIYFAVISFVINLILYLFKRDLFVHYNKFNSFYSVIVLIVFAVMGGGYVIVYATHVLEGVVDSGGIFSISMNTYAYIPLAIMAVLCIGIGLAKVAGDKINVEYKILAKSEGDGETVLKLENADGLGGDSGKNSQEPVSLDPIPAFTELDNKLPQFELGYQDRQSRRFKNLTLPKLVAHVIEYAACSKEKLSYSSTDIKTFIAGLAASRLAILQGMSGTGKTSLPKIFMESISGDCDIVAVESSWRDKHELTGYYNEFNKKFTPKSFTQFLYKAALNPDIPCFIVLDELNLSRIEYYFSDFLSLIESREDERFIKLYDVQLFPADENRSRYLALRDGHTIDIPKNVWFIGTANRDESTFEISDKVYDRAQTIIFNKRAPKVQSRQVEYPKGFVPYSELKRLFGESKSIQFDAENNAVIKKVESLLAPYKISFGNRVLKQMEDFIRIFVACSEVKSNADYNKYLQEGLDCILLSKVIRKLELKQINDLDSLIEEFEALKLPKCTEFLLSFEEMD